MRIFFRSKSFKDDSKMEDSKLKFVAARSILTQAATNKSIIMPMNAFPFVAQGK